jgi:hypothetical protein
MQMKIQKATLAITTISLGILLILAVKIFHRSKPDKDNNHDKGIKIEENAFGQYISDFLSKYKLRTNASLYAIGGHLDIAYLINWMNAANSPDIDVLNIFPCFNPAGPSFFTYYGTSTVKDTTVSCGCNTPATLKSSAGEFPYTNPNFAPDDIINHFKMTAIPLPVAYPAAQAGQLNTYITEFYRKYSNDDNPPVAYNKKPCAAFWKNEVKEILDQTDVSTPGFHITGVAYFLGYDSRMNDNKIRIIIAGVDQNGKVYLKRSNGDPAKIIEKAWPPDNCQ